MTEKQIFKCSQRNKGGGWTDGEGLPIPADTPGQAAEEYAAQHGGRIEQIRVKLPDDSWRIYSARISLTESYRESPASPDEKPQPPTEECADALPHKLSASDSLGKQLLRIAGEVKTSVLREHASRAVYFQEIGELLTQLAETELRIFALSADHYWEPWARHHLPDAPGTSMEDLRLLRNNIERRLNVLYRDLSITVGNGHEHLAELRRTIELIRKAFDRIESQKLADARAGVTSIGPGIQITKPPTESE